MKKLPLFLVVFIPVVLLSQVGIGTDDPDASAVLDVTSAAAGVLFPRMTTSERNMIANPARGLLIFNNETAYFEYNNGTPTSPNWISLVNVDATNQKDVKGFVQANGNATVSSADVVSKPAGSDGTYLFTFNDAVPDTNYSVIATTERASNSDDIFIGIANRTTTSFEFIATVEDNGTTTAEFIDTAFSFYLTHPSSTVSASSEFGYLDAGGGFSFDGQGFTVTRQETGRYRFTFNTPKTDTNYVVNATCDRAAATNDVFIGIGNRNTNYFDVLTTTEDDGGTTGNYIDVNFSVIVF